MMEQKVNLYIMMLLTMVYLVQGNNVMAGYCIISLFFFLFGTYIKNISGTRDRKATLYNLIIPTLLQQATLLITRAILWIANSHSLFILFLALSMGLQNGITTHLHKITIHTTYITGMSTALLKILTGEISSDKCKLRRVLSSELISTTIRVVGIDSLLSGENDIPHPTGFIAKRLNATHLLPL